MNNLNIGKWLSLMGFQMIETKMKMCEQQEICGVDQKHLEKWGKVRELLFISTLSQVIN